jgi:hypothetical protein
MILRIDTHAHLYHMPSLSDAVLGRIKDRFTFPNYAEKSVSFDGDSSKTPPLLSTGAFFGRWVTLKYRGPWSIITRKPN